ncbi:MAG: hypothetical protein OXC93_13935 [Rhodospirillaceae bacterium]|nr:hypothetical protein [Rhodospirillaceae bacterium]
MCRNASRRRSVAGDGGATLLAWVRPSAREGFGWVKTVAGFSKTRYHGLARVD